MLFCSILLMVSSLVFLVAAVVSVGAVQYGAHGNALEVCSDGEEGCGALDMGTANGNAAQGDEEGGGVQQPLLQQK
jgi:hypothetical protein